jgi:hypothetical protein
MQRLGTARSGVALLRREPPPEALPATTPRRLQVKASVGATGLLAYIDHATGCCHVARLGDAQPIVGRVKGEHRAGVLPPEQAYFTAILPPEQANFTAILPAQPRVGAASPRSLDAAATPHPGVPAGAFAGTVVEPQLLAAPSSHK